MRLSDATDVRLGDDPVARVYLGSEQVWPIGSTGPTVLLHDDFSADSGKFLLSSPTNTVIQNGYLTLTHTPEYAADVRSAQQFTAPTSLEFSVEVVRSANHTNANGVETYLGFDLLSSGAGLGFDIASNYLEAYYTPPGGAYTSVFFDPAWPLATRRWLRITATAAGLVIWSYSTDGVNYNSLGSWQSAINPAANAEVFIGAGTWDATPTETTLIDNITVTAT